MGKRGAKKGEKRRAGIPNKSTQEIKEILAQEVDFRVVARKMFELVKGVTVKETGSDGEAIVYEKEPNVPAAKLLMEYGFGKPKESVDITTDGKSLVQVIRDDIR